MAFYTLVINCVGIMEIGHWMEWWNTIKVFHVVLKKKETSREMNENCRGR